VAVATAMFPVPSNEVPPIVLAVAKAVAVPASPTAILAVPSNEVPPIVLALANAVVVADRATAIFADPSKDVPPIVLAVVSVAAEPVVFWLRVSARVLVTFVNAIIFLSYHV
jgi:hypothetical protein